MPQQDKALLMHKVEDVLKPRMFANLLEEAVDGIQDQLDDFDVSYIADNRPETEDLVDVYINAKRVGGRSEKTLLRYRYLIEKFLKHANVRTRDVLPAHVRDYLAGELGRGIAESTLEATRQVLHAYFDWLDHEKLIRQNPMSNIESIKCQKKERLSLTYAEIEVIKRSCENVRDLAIVTFLLATGCRISEAVGLNKEDVDFNNGECIVLGKGNKERTVFMDDVASLTVREYLATRTDSNPALFVGKGGKRLQPGGVRVMLKRVEQRSGIENIHPHRFRRTLVTRLLNRGMPIQEVAIIVGHEKLDTTMRYYSSNKSRIKNSYRIYTA